MRKLPSLEEVIKIEEVKLEEARKKERAVNRENRVSVGDVIRSVTKENSSSDEKPAIKLPERENSSNTSIPSNKKPTIFHCFCSCLEK